MNIRCDFFFAQTKKMRSFKKVPGFRKSWTNLSGMNCWHFFGFFMWLQRYKQSSKDSRFSKNFSQNVFPSIVYHLIGKWCALVNSMHSDSINLKHITDKCGVEEANTKREKEKEDGKNEEGERARARHNFAHKTHNQSFLPHTHTHAHTTTCFHFACARMWIQLYILSLIVCMLTAFATLYAPVNGYADGGLGMFNKYKM